MTDNDIIKYFYSDKNGNTINRVSRYKIKNISDEIMKYILNRYNDNSTDDIHEIIYRIKNNINILPVCYICGKPLKFNVRGYPTVCSISCAGKASYLTSSKKYNTKNIFDIHKEKTQATILKKYGVKNVSQSDIIKKKKKETFIKHYGVENNYCREEIKEKNRLINKLNKEQILEKRKKTNNEKYGVDFYLSLNKGKHLTQEHKEKIGNTIKSEKFQTYRSNKLKENNTFNKSYIEEAFYKLFTSKYNNVIRQYKSKDYPFSCDFYIKDIDTYIEIQGSHYHHFHPFDKNNIDDIKELERLKTLSINHPQYDNIIKVWTELDVNKRKIAKDNNLNYIELFPDDYKDNKELYNIVKELKTNNYFKKETQS